MAAQQIQVKLFTYSVVERKDEIEEVSAAATASAAAATTVDGRRRHSLSRRTRAHYRTYNAVPCVCMTRTSSSDYTSCARDVYVDRCRHRRRSSRSGRRRRVFILFSPLEIRTVLPNGPESYDRPQ